MNPVIEPTLPQVEKIIRDFWNTAPSNSLHFEHPEKSWDEPLVAVARGDDPLFDRFKEMIGPFYWTPAEAFERAFPTKPPPPSELRVISYVLPQTEKTRMDQRHEETLPAERWARSRHYGEEFNCDLRRHLSDTLTQGGYPSVAPDRLPGFGYRQSERFGLASNWSERHAAFIAGLGTFGLSDGLITRRGKAVRLGSVVSRIDLPVTQRPYGDDHHAWCLWYAEGTCGACVTRCPAEAITASEGHDKTACYQYIREVTTPYTVERYGTGSTPCGLCQVGIPCEATAPKSLLSKA